MGVVAWHSTTVKILQPTSRVLFWIFFPQNTLSSVILHAMLFYFPHSHGICQAKTVLICFSCLSTNQQSHHCVSTLVCQCPVFVCSEAKVVLLAGGSKFLVTISQFLFNHNSGKPQFFYLTNCGRYHSISCGAFLFP